MLIIREKAIGHHRTTLRLRQDSKFNEVQALPVTSLLTICVDGKCFLFLRVGAHHLFELSLAKAL